MSYVPLGIRTEFSFGQSMCRVDDLVERARSLQLPAMGVADLHATWALPGFVTAARNAGIRPLVAARLHVPAGAETQAQLTLHAMNRAGFANLIRLVNCALDRAAHDAPAAGVTWADLADACEGILALDGAEDGPVGQQLRKNGIHAGLRAAAQLKDVFGAGQLFIEVRRGGADPRRLVEADTLRVARSLNVPVVATADVRYVDAQDARAAAVLRRLPRFGGSTAHCEPAGRNHAHLRSPGEMQRLFVDLPEALEATFLVAEKCSLATDALMTPQPDVDRDRAQQAELAQRCARAACERFETHTFMDVPAAVRDRIAAELAAIEEANLASGFLLASDAQRHAARKNIPIGSGPGAAAGSLVAFTLALTEVDPLQHGLDFRATGAARRGMPREIHLQVGHRGRAELLRVIKASGRCALAHVATVGRLSGVGLLRDVASTLGLTVAETARAEALVADHGFDAAALELSAALSHGHRESASVHEAVEVCSRLEGLPYHAFPRAGSLLVLPAAAAACVALQPVAEQIPEQVMVQLTERDAEALGWLRVELHSARHLSMVADAAGWASKRGTSIRMENIPLDDEPTFRRLAHGDTSCVVHLEQARAQDLLSRVQPARLNELADVLALGVQARAGLDQSETFVARRSGRAPTPAGSTHVLASTHGLILYAEQLFEVATHVAGMDSRAAQAWQYGLCSGDRTRTGRLQRDFIVGALEGGTELEAAEALFAQAMRSNPVASRAQCVSMALDAYRAAYLLVHREHEFVFSLLRNSQGQSVRQARARGLVPGRAGAGALHAVLQAPARRQLDRARQLQLALLPGGATEKGQERETRPRTRMAAGRARVWLAGQIRRRA